MSAKWTRNPGESGILRKSEFKEKKEELFVFGYSCKLFRNDDRAQHIDQGKHLIPWMGDETLKIDRYDARGALHDLSRFEAPPGGYDWRVELTKTEYDVEQMCDEERYRALHTDEDEELMYKEEELKRLHAAGYGQVGFNYDAPAEPKQEQPPAEVEEPFIPTAAFKALFLHDVLFPDTQKQNAIIEKTAKFIANQGIQMEILIKAKQGDNPQFKFLNKEDVLHPYYTALTALVKTGKWPEKEPEVVEEKPHEPEEYLHPSLASTVIESAPSIPSIHYKPSADCDYTMLISKMRCEGETSTLAPGELPPPGTEPANYPPRVLFNAQVPPPILGIPPQAIYQQFATYHKPVPVPQYTAIPKSEPTLSSLLANYGSGSDTEQSDSEDSASIDKACEVIPPDDVKLVIEKMSTYVARNGDEFADIVRAKNDPRFTFLDPANIYHPYYNKLMREKRGEINGNSEIRTKPPVSFSIKKMKEPDPILPKPALPYESSSDEDPEKQADKQADNVEEFKETKPVPIVTQQLNVNMVPHAVIYKMEGQLTQNLPTITTIEHMKPFVAKPVVMEVKDTPKPERIIIESINKDADNNETKNEKIKEVENKMDKTKDENKKEKLEVVKEKSVSKESSPVVDKIIENRIENSNDNHRKDKPKENDVKDKDESSNYKRDKKRYKDRRDYRSKSQSKDREKRSRSREREKRREKERDREKRKKKAEKDDLESEIISLGDNSDDMIDLTGDQSDSKGEGESEAEKAKQLERRRRAAEFLKKVGVDPAAAALPTNSLASAMVETLESIRKKKAAEEEKRRRKEKRRKREKREYEEYEKLHRKSKRRKHKSSEDDEEPDYESSKRKKRKKDKKTSKKKKKRHEPVEEGSEMEEDQQLPANLDLSSTLKELRTNSPTKNLMLPDIEENIANETSSEEEREEKSPKKKKEREYSEGEWSSDSEADSNSSGEKRSKMDNKYAGERSPIKESY